MAISPNYSWPLPDDTDLVKNGAEAIRDLGNAIDNTVENLPSGGLVHINSTTFSAVASQSFDNVFSATYSNYKIFVNINSASTSNTFRLRLRAAGTDNSSSNYVISGIVRYTDNGTALQGNTGTTSFQLGRFHTTGGWAESLIINPFDTLETKYYSRGTRRPATTPEAEWSGGNMTVTDSYNGFTVLATSGNITGSISVFAYRKS